MTVVRAHGGRRLCKMICANGTVVPCDAARRFDLHAVPVADLAALAELLHRLLRRADCALVRGAVADAACARGVRRLLHPDPETGEMSTLREAPRRWLALDVDGLPLPAGTDPRDLAACAAAALPVLPVELRATACLVQATGSHGVKPGARLRLWFWCDRPVTGIEAARWFRTAPVDRSVFRPAQLILTAAPVFAAGVADPLPRRLVLLPGAPTVAVPPPAVLAPPPAPPRPAPQARALGAGRYALAALTRAVGRVARAPEGARHPTILAEAWGLARLVNARLLGEGDVRRALLAAAECCGVPPKEAEAVVAWALGHRPDAAAGSGAR